MRRCASAGVIAYRRLWIKADDAALADVIGRAWTKMGLKTEGWFILRLRKNGRHTIEFPE
jgi:hypothetical protein